MQVYNGFFKRERRIAPDSWYTIITIAHKMGIGSVESKVKSICVITTVHDVFDVRIFQKECKTLRNAGYHVSLIAQHIRNDYIDGVQIVALPVTKSRFRRIFFLSMKAFQLSLRQKADVYHFHDPELIPMALLLRILNKKVIYDVHEDYPRDILTKEWLPKVLRKIIASFFEIFENWAFRYMNFTIAATPFIRDRFFKYGHRVLDLNNFPVLGEFYIHSSSFSQKERAVCYIGGIENIRGLFEMVRGIGQTDVKLLLAGEFSSVSQCETAASMNGWSQVQYFGQLSRKDLAAILFKSIAGVILFHPVPNHINAQPNKMFEYMSAGIPVIASNFPLWKQIIEENQCGICVDPLKSKEIAEAIQRLVDNPDEASSMGANGRKAIEAKYNWDAESAKLLKVYKEVIN